MSDYIINMMPLQGDESVRFEGALPQAVHVYAGRSTVTREQLEKATVILGWPRTGSVAQAKELKWLHSMWSGVDEYLKADCLPSGAVLTCSAGTNSQSVAEHMLAMLLALCRKLPLCRDFQREHRWETYAVGNMRTIAGATVLVVGTGSVGLHFAGLCKALGARTAGLRRRVGELPPQLDELHAMDQLDRLLPQADVVALALPHTGETAGLMDRRRLGLMKPDAMLLSSGRGTVLDQEALADALTEGRLWGAAMDVAEPEPLPPDSPLWDIPNLLITPHVAGGMRLEITRKNCVALALENLRRYGADQPLLNVVSWEG